MRDAESSGGPGPETAWPQSVAMLSMHTSPLTQPGSGDAGGMNVYIAKSAAALAELGVAVDVFTLDTSAHGSQAPTWASTQLQPGFAVHTASLPAARRASKESLPSHIAAWTELVAERVGRPDVLHSHYWLSGIAGVALASQLRRPLVHTMHTIGAAKNAHRADGDVVEPTERILAEKSIVSFAQQLTANSLSEADDLAAYCSADRAEITIAAPGVDTDVFCAGDRHDARRRFDLLAEDFVIAFIGRLQAHKAPDLVVRALAALRHSDRGLSDRAIAIICGGESGNAGMSAGHLRALARELGVGEQVRVMPAMEPADVAELMRAADTVMMPSASETFGMVALEAQACGTPVIASDRGGLRTAVDDARSGILVASREPAEWAAALIEVAKPEIRARMSAQAHEHARGFTWASTSRALLDSYARARRKMTS